MFLCKYFNVYMLSLLLDDHASGWFSTKNIPVNKAEPFYSSIGISGYHFWWMFIPAFKTNIHQLHLKKKTQEPWLILISPPPLCRKISAEKVSCHCKESFPIKQRQNSMLENFIWIQISHGSRNAPKIPSRKLIYPTLGKENHLQKRLW